jgi:peptide/nickel transport system substrate-binding protein
VAVPAGTPFHDTGSHPLPATGPYEVATDTQHQIVLVRNPHFHEWSHAAQPDGYPDRIVWRIGAIVEAAVTAVKPGQADYTLDPPPPDRLNEVRTRFPSQLHVTLDDVTIALGLNTTVAPFNDVWVRQAQLRRRSGQARPAAGTGLAPDLSGPATRRARLPPVLSLHPEPQPRRRLERTRSRHRPTSYLSIAHPRDTDHDL